MQTRSKTPQRGPGRGQEQGWEHPRGRGEAFSERPRESPAPRINVIPPSRPIRRSLQPLQTRTAHEETQAGPLSSPPLLYLFTQLVYRYRLQRVRVFAPPPTPHPKIKLYEIQAGCTLTDNVFILFSFTFCTM